MPKETQAADSSAADTNVRHYELMLILDPELLEGKSKKKFTEIEDFIKQGGGKVTQSDIWGKQKLAYRIGKHREGNYAVFNFTSEPAFLSEINEHLRIDTSVIRHLITTIADDYEYIKFDMSEEPKPEKPKKHMTRKEKEENVSIKHSTAPKKAEAPKKAKKEESKEVDEKELDAKLDEIIGGDTINL